MKSDLILLGNADIDKLEQLAKEAGFASFAGGVLDKVAPNFTKEFIRPGWQGLKTQWNAGDRSVDGLLSGVGKGIEANRFNTSGLGQKLNDYGVAVNKDMYGRPLYDNPIDFGKTLSNAGSSIWGGLSSLAGKIPGLSNLGQGLFNNNSSPTSVPSAPTPSLFSGVGTPTAYNKYASLGLLAGNLPMQEFPAQLSSFLNPPPAPQKQTPSISPDFNITAENKKLKRLVDDPRTREYILSLLK